MQISFPRVSLASLPPRGLDQTDDSFRLQTHRHLSSLFKEWHIGEIAWIEILRVPNIQNAIKINIFMSSWYPSFHSYMLQRQLDWSGSTIMDLGCYQLDPNPVSHNDNIWRWEINIYYPTLSNTLPFPPPLLRRSNQV